MVKTRILSANCTNTFCMTLAIPRKQILFVQVAFTGLSL